MAGPVLVHQRLKRWGALLGRGLLLLVLTGAGLLALEWLTRLFLPAHDPAGQLGFVRENGVPLAPRGFQGRQWKNTGDYDVAVRINRIGLRDNKDLRDSTAADLFVVGDSFSLGWGVEEGERFSNLLQDRLGLPVYNLAIPTDFDGYDRLLGHARDNGAVIARLMVGVCMENDLRDYRPLPPLPPLSQPLPRRAPLALSTARIKLFLSGSSAVYCAMTSIIHQHPGIRELMIRLGWITENIAGMGRNRFDAAMIRDSADRLRRFVDEHQVEQALMVLIPSRGLWVGGNEAEERRVHEAFVAALAERGMETLDLRPWFEEGGDPLGFHFKADGHWNRDGHALAAWAIHGYLVGNWGLGRVKTGETAPPAPFPSTPRDPP